MFSSPQPANQPSDTHQDFAVFSFQFSRSLFNHGASLAVAMAEGVEKRRWMIDRCGEKRDEWCSVVLSLSSFLFLFVHLPSEMKSHGVLPLLRKGVGWTREKIASRLRWNNNNNPNLALPLKTKSFCVPLVTRSIPYLSSFLPSSIPFSLIEIVPKHGRQSD